MTERMRIIDEPVRGTIGDMGLMALPGLEVARRAAAGELARPPIHHLFGLTPTEAGLGKSTFSMPVTRWLEDQAGIMWGGIFALLADAPLGVSLYTGLPPGKGVATAELFLSYVRPMTRDTGTVVGRGQAIHMGRDVGLSQVHIEDRHGRLLAHGTTRCVFPDIPIVSDLDPLPVPDPIEDPPDPYLRPVPADGYRPLSDLHDNWPIEVSKRYISGEWGPGPIHMLTGLEPLTIEEGRASAGLPKSAWFSAGGPTVYGGVLAFLADIGLGAAFWSTLEPGEVFASLDMEVRFLRPVFPGDGQLEAHGEVRHRGRNILVAHCELLDGEKRVAIATGSAMVVRGGIAELMRGRLPDEIVVGD